MTKRTILVLIICLISTATFAQTRNAKTTRTTRTSKTTKTNKTTAKEATSFNTQRTIRLENQNEEEEITLKIDRQTKKFDLMIEALVSSGKLTIEIYDSNKKKRGTFTVQTQLKSKKSERARGHITKSLIDPEPGYWRIKIIPTNVNGSININAATTL